MVLRDTKRILIDATNVDISAYGGGTFCTKAYIEALLALFPGRIDIMHPAEAHIRDTRYTTIDVPGRTKMRQIIEFGRGRFHRGAHVIIDYLRAHANQYQTLVMSSGLLAGAVIPKVKKLGIQVIVLHHNFEPEYQLDSRSIISFKGKTDLLVRHWERKGYIKADINLFLTEQDKSMFEKEYGSRPNNYVSGVFEPTLDQQPLTKQTLQKSAVITCALADKQNEAPLIRFAEQYVPVFQEILPNWHITLMGRNPLDAIRQMAAQHDTITLIPNPDDIRAMAAESAIYLCPMDAGGGIKLRIMDGLRAGQPVLTHVRSARGYDALMGEPYFCTYDDPDSFSKGLQQIVHYLNSPEFSRAQIQRTYYTLFGLEAGIRRLKEILCR